MFMMSPNKTADMILQAEGCAESNNINAFEGNIYCGIVRNILPGMQSAFVDIGEDKNAFLHIKQQ